MIVECPKCKSTFRVAADIEKKSFSNFKCSICEHIWKVTVQGQRQRLNQSQKKENNYSYVLILNLVIFVMVIVALVFLKEELIYSNSFWIQFYEFFYNLIPIK